MRIFKRVAVNELKTIQGEKNKRPCMVKINSLRKRMEMMVMILFQKSSSRIKSFRLPEQYTPHQNSLKLLKLLFWKLSHKSCPIHLHSVLFFSIPFSLIKTYLLECYSIKECYGWTKMMYRICPE